MQYSNTSRTVDQRSRFLLLVSCVSDLTDERQQFLDEFNRQQAKLLESASSSSTASSSTSTSSSSPPPQSKNAWIAKANRGAKGQCWWHMGWSDKESGKGPCLRSISHSHCSRMSPPSLSGSSIYVSDDAQKLIAYIDARGQSSEKPRESYIQMHLYVSCHSTGACGGWSVCFVIFFR